MDSNSKNILSIDEEEKNEEAKVEISNEEEIKDGSSRSFQDLNSDSNIIAEEYGFLSDTYPTKISSH